MSNLVQIEAKDRNISQGNFVRGSYLGTLVREDGSYHLHRAQEFVQTTYSGQGYFKETGDLFIVSMDTVNVKGLDFFKYRYSVAINKDGFLRSKHPHVTPIHPHLAIAAEQLAVIIEREQLSTVPIAMTQSRFSS